MNLRRSAGLILGLFMAGAASLSAAADSFPKAPIKLVVSFAPGSVADNVARMVTEEAARTLGRPIVVENRAGANGTIGAQAVANAKPDGYTLLFGTNSPLAAAESLYKNLPYDQIKSFEPVSFVGGIPLITVVNNDLPVQSLPELIRYAKDHPGKLMFGAASSSQLGTTALLNSTTGMDMVYVPYKGSPDAIIGLVRGDIQVYSAEVLAMAPQVRDGKVRALSISSRTRSSLLPDVPTVSETLGNDDFEIFAWFAIVAPAGTPAPIVETLNKAFNAAVANPATQERMAAVGLQPKLQSSAEFGQFMRSEAVKWEKIIRGAGIEPQ